MIDIQSDPDKLDRRQRLRVPFNERVTCSVTDACEASSIKRAKLYALMKEGRLEFTHVDKRRLVFVQSLLKLLRA